MACAERLFFGIPIVAEAPPDLADRWGCARTGPGLLLFARSALLWRLVRTRRIRGLMTAGRDAVAPLGGIARRQIRIATGCATGDYVPLQSVVRILARAEADSATVFLVDSATDALRSLEGNTRDTFPGLRVVGRATLNHHIADSVTTAIRKAEPRIVLVGSARGHVLRWIAESIDGVGNALIVIAPDAVSRMISRRDGSPLTSAILLPLRILMIPVLLIHRIALHRRQKKRPV